VSLQLNDMRLCMVAYPKDKLNANVGKRMAVLTLTQVVILRKTGGKVNDTWMCIVVM